MSTVISKQMCSMIGPGLATDEIRHGRLVDTDHIGDTHLRKTLRVKFSNLCHEFNGQVRSIGLRSGPSRPRQTTLAGGIPHVRSLIAKKEMLRIHACRDVTLVQDKEPNRYLAPVKSPANTVSLAWHSPAVCSPLTCCDLPVPMIVHGCGPDPAAIVPVRSVDFGEEPLLECSHAGIR